MFASVLAMVCVVYSDGLTHCDVRTQYEVEVPSTELAKSALNAHVVQLSVDALQDPEVLYVSETKAESYETNEELDNALNELTDKFNADNTSYETTSY